jgi:hypothetical protein
MSNYTPSTNFATKDALPSGDPLKIVKGTEINTEFVNIQTAIATKADLASPTFTGTPAAPTASAGTNSTQLATTAFVKTAIDNYDAALTVSTAQIEDAAVTTAKIADASVTSDKLANGAATGAKLGSDVVVTTGDQTINGTKTFTNGVRFNDGSTQTSALPSGIDAIGSVCWFFTSWGSNTIAGNTVSGAYLFRWTTWNAPDNVYTIQSNGNALQIMSTAGLGTYGNFVNRTTALSGLSRTISPTTGTWRILSAFPKCLYENTYNYTWYPSTLAIRIA